MLCTFHVFSIKRVFLIKIINKCQVDHSSCGSNTPSGSEVETDALEKHEKGTEEPEPEEPKEPKELDLNLLASDSNYRRSRSISNINDPWKEVSEEVV